MGIGFNSFNGAGTVVHLFVSLCSCMVVLLLFPIESVYAESGETSSTSTTRALIPPTLVERVEPVFPPDELEDGQEIEVELIVEISVSGEVDNISILRSGGEAFDSAAKDAVSQWLFKPAFMDGSAIAGRIRVPITFVYEFADEQSVPTKQEAALESVQPVESKEISEHDGVKTATDVQRADDDDFPKGSGYFDAPEQQSEFGASVGSEFESESPDVDDEDFAVFPDLSELAEYDDSADYLEVTVAGERRPRATATAEYVVELGNLRVVPRRSAAEQLMMAPGVLTTNHGGEGHAHETFMRGFASKEGQDIEYVVDGVPINDVSNPHGHGYADIYFIPDELVRSVRIIEGPFDPAQGDFAFIGSANYQLGLDDKGARLSYGLGSWGRQRFMLAYAPPDGHDDSFGAFELSSQNGFGPNRASQRALALGRYSGILHGSAITWRLSAYGYSTRFDQAGLVRQDDYLTGRIGFFDTYDSNQGGESNRALLALDIVSGEASRRIRQATWIGLRAMRLRENFTGWMTDTPVNPDGTLNTQRGDGLEQRYNNLSVGSRGSYDLSIALRDLAQTLSLGYAFRWDQGQSSQYRLRSVTAIPYLRVFDDEYAVVNLAGWIRAQVRPVRRLTLRGGARIDGFSFGLIDLNQPSADREGAREPTQTRQSFGYAMNPRVTADFRLVSDLHLVASYGHGTRSSDAAALSDNETAPFARAHVSEGGLAYNGVIESLGLELKSQLAYVLTKVDKDMLFDPVAGRNILFSSPGSGISVGPSTRHAVLFSTRLDYAKRFDSLINIGWARGTLDSTGELIPYVPELVARIDTGVSGNLFDWRIGNVPVSGRSGLSFTYVPGRPLPYQAKGDDYCLFNMAANMRLWHLSLGLEVRNILDLRYREAEFNFPSNFRGPEASLSQGPMRHFSAGEPRTILATFTLHLEDLAGVAP